MRYARQLQAFGGAAVLSYSGAQSSWLDPQVLGPGNYRRSNRQLSTYSIWAEVAVQQAEVDDGEVPAEVGEPDLLLSNFMNGTKRLPATWTPEKKP